MKHSPRVTILLILFFFISQVIGLGIISQYIVVEEVIKVDILTNESYTINESVAVALPNNMERPEFQSSVGFIAYLVIAIVITTMLFLFIIKFKTSFLWKLWFFFAVFLCLTISLAPFMDAVLATIFGFILAAWKIARPNIIIHNLTELFVYGGIAAILVPVSAVTSFTMIIVLLLISVYDAYAVWKSQHMVKLARYQAESKVFAGLFVPYSMPKGGKSLPAIPQKELKGKVQYKGIKTAVLGGGDIAFPLLFSGAVFKELIVVQGFSLAFLHVLIIPVFVTIALALLFLNGKQNRFYPAMPFLTVGCLVGYGIMLLVI